MLLQAEAPAKINRELRVGGRRPDGFHEIRSRLCSIDFSDRLEVEKAEGLELSCSGIPVPGGDANLVVRAARALAKRLEIVPRARIRLEKRIPAGTGLGGASADAAVALLLLSRLWDSPIPARELLPTAAQLGSDVPFFLIGGEADVAGRGEQVTPREDPPSKELLILMPPFPVSTERVYAAYSRLTGGICRLPDRLEIEKSGNFLGPNDLASAVLETQSRMADYLRSAGRVSSEFGITGSGSALVLCGVTAEAERWLAESHPEATLRRARPLGREEYGRRTSLSGGSAWKSPR